MNEARVRERRTVTVRGIVQGVGFRPFIYALARRYGLAGVVRNDSQGVSIEVEGSGENLDLFLRSIWDEAPPLARVESADWQQTPAQGEGEFRIEESREGDERRALISPDVAVCGECLEELFDPANRRYRYPFINCTNCGPRFTITRSVPYDRAMTTMAGFTMCPACRREYENPADRRFHAQPNACPACGPAVQLLDRFGHELRSEGRNPVAHAAELLHEGAIVAVKGLGGYHLACDPFNIESVHALRSRKVRQDKPFALMARDLEQVRLLCTVEAEEAALLTSPARPIVLLAHPHPQPLSRPRERGAYLSNFPPLPRAGEGGRGVRVTDEVAPRQKRLGVMLAYTPLHHLLLHDCGIPLVMTSGNRADEPIAYRDEEAFEQLGQIADYFLIHNRPIHMRCDDSVVRVADRSLYPIRRSRGYAPAPLRVRQGFSRHILACGGQLKNTFCLAKEGYAFVGHHIGDLENYETLRSFREGVEHYCRLFEVQPELVAHDLHPEYLSTKYASELEEAGLPAVGIQHHHAHIAACLTDNERPAEERVIGVALDGTGYGVDGTIWGGEVLEGSVREGFVRRGHLAHVPLPGGEAAIRQPWRTAIAQLVALYGEEEVLRLPLQVIQRAGERNVRLIGQLVRSGTNTPVTSSAGRLFDAVAALVGVPGTDRVTYEGQAAIELELAMDLVEKHAYPFKLRWDGGTWVVETREVIAAVVEDVLAGREPGQISARFHRTVAEIVATCCERLREAEGVGTVALSGGTFQNALLLEQTTELLWERSFVVYRHRRVPANDGGISLGQAILAEWLFRDRDG